MAKKKPVSRPRRTGPFPARGQANTQKNQLVWHMDVVSKMTVQCWSCMREEEDESTELQFADWLFYQGWRHVSSKEYQTIGVVCPECLKNEDGEGVGDAVLET